MINFLSFTVKELILGKALKAGSLNHEGFIYQIRSDLSKRTAQRQWELGTRMSELRGKGAQVQLRFPAMLKIMWRNKMYNISDPEEVGIYTTDG